MVYSLNTLCLGQKELQVQAVFRERRNNLLENSLEKPGFKRLLRQYGMPSSKVALAHRLSSILWRFSVMLSRPEEEDKGTPEVYPGTWQSLSLRGLCFVAHRMSDILWGTLTR